MSKGQGNVRYQVVKAYTLPSVQNVNAANTIALGGKRKFQCTLCHRLLSSRHNIIHHINTAHGITSLKTEDKEDPGSSEMPEAKGIDWTSQSVPALIESFKDLRENFSCTTLTKKQAWNIVAERMMADGHKVTADQCDAKWRALKHRYKTICDKQRHNKHSKRSWEYFTSMDEILHDDPSMSPLLEPLPLALPLPYKQPTILPMPQQPSIIIRTEPMDTKPDMGIPGASPAKKKKVTEDSHEELVKLREDIVGRLDQLIAKQEESNEIQRERNGLLKGFGDLLQVHLSK